MSRAIKKAMAGIFHNYVIRNGPLNFLACHNTPLPRHKSQLYPFFCARQRWALRRILTALWVIVNQQHEGIYSPRLD